MSTKGCVGFFLFWSDLEFFPKIKKAWFLHNRFFTFLLITQDLNKTKKNSEHPFLEINKYKMCAKFQQKVLNSKVVGACQSFEICRQKYMASRKQ